MSNVVLHVLFAVSLRFAPGSSNYRPREVLFRNVHSRRADASSDPRKVLAQGELYIGTVVYRAYNLREIFGCRSFAYLRSLTHPF